MRNIKLKTPLLIMIPTVFLLIASTLFSLWIYKSKNTQISTLNETISSLNKKITELQNTIENKNALLFARYTAYDKCDNNSCLFNRGSIIEGFTKITGYYTPWDTLNWSNEPVTCSGFTVKEGNEEILDQYIKSVKSGNAVNSMNENEELILTINLDGLSEVEKTKIMSSNPENLVELSIIVNRASGRGVPTCYSNISILGTN